MKRLVCWIFVIGMLGAGALVGCGGAKDQTANEAATPAGDAATGDVSATTGSETTEGTETATPGSGTIETTPGRIPAPAEAVAASFAGNLGCGHCTFHVKESCTLAMKTEAGEIYILEAGPRQDELFSKRYDEPAVLVAGSVDEVDGVKVLHAESVELR